MVVSSLYASCLGDGVHGCGDSNVCCSGLLCQMGGDVSDIADPTHYCTPISNWVPPMTMGCGSLPGHSEAFYQTNYSELKYNNYGAISEWCDTASLVCDANLGCVAPAPPPPTCSSATGGQCSDTYTGNYKFTCLPNQVIAGNSYECSYNCCVSEQCSNLSDLNGACSGNFNSCPNGKTETYATGTVTNTCNTGLCCTTKQSCNGGDTQTGACSATSPGANTCGTYPGTYQVAKTTYTHSQCGQANTAGNGYTCTPSTACNQNSYYPGCTTGFEDHCSNNYTCTNGNTCTTSIFVHVYTDYNHNGAQDGSDAGKQSVTVGDGTTNLQSDSNGSVVFGAKITGNYTITETVPANFQAVNSSSQGVSLTNNSGNATVNFFLTPLYAISGNVFTDLNKNQKDDGSDTGYGGGTMHITNGPTAVADITVAGNGTWTTPTTLLAGTYTVSYTTALPTDYTFTTPSSFAVTVGDPAGSPSCNKGGSLDATCGGTNNGSVLNLNIGLTNENAWQQSVCMDVRDDSGSYTDLIPASPSCGGVTGAYNSITNADCTTGAGIIFTCDATPDFGLGSANANSWQAGGLGATDQECYSGAGLDVVRTSYDYLTTTMQQSDITPIDLGPICSGGIGNCTLPNNLGKGVYIANGDLHLNTYTFPVDASSPQGFIFLVDGDLYVDGNILVPAGSVAAFSSKGNIIVNKSVGNTITSANDPANNTPNIEGLYSADASFIVESKGSGTSICNADGTPLDSKLNIVGSVITNAAKAGGSFQNDRDLCTYDTSCSAVSLGDGAAAGDSGLALSYLLTLYADGKFLTHQVFNWEELRPQKINQ